MAWATVGPGAKDSPVGDIVGEGSAIGVAVNPTVVWAGVAFASGARVAWATVESGVETSAVGEDSEAAIVVGGDIVGEGSETGVAVNPMAVWAGVSCTTVDLGVEVSPSTVVVGGSQPATTDIRASVAKQAFRTVRGMTRMDG